MSLALLLTYGSITSNCKTVTIPDSTGNYDAVTNPTGYGAPNEDRSNLYIKFLVNLFKSTGREPIDLLASYNPNTVTTWSYNITESGWYEIYAFACLAYSSIISYGLNEITYDVSTNLFYKSLTAGNIGNSVTNPTYWETTEDVEDYTAAVASGQVNVYEYTLNKIEICSLNKCEAKALLKAKCDSCDKCQLQAYEKLRLKLEAIVINEALGNFTEAQEIVEEANIICGDLADCGCN